MKLFRRVDGKLSRKGNKGHFWRVSSVTLLYTPPVKLPVPAQDVLQQLCWKINKLYMKFAGLHLFVFYFTVYLLRLFCPVIGEAVDDRTWLEVRPSDVTLTVFTLSFPHSHHCHPDTLDSVSWWSILVENWSIETKQEGGEDKTTSDPLRADLALCNTIRCTPPKLIPLKLTFILPLINRYTV